MFDQPLSTNHPLFHQLKYDFQTLHMLQLVFRIGNKYRDTEALHQAFSKMIMNKLNMVIHDEKQNSTETYEHVIEFHNLFEAEFARLNLKDLILMRPSEEERMLIQRRNDAEFAIGKVQKAL